jgi:hypothetical protein
MTQGRPTLPIEQKRLKGTLRTDRLPDGAQLVPLTNQEDKPEPIGVLGKVATSFWQLAWAMPWLSHSSDYSIVLITAQAIDEREVVRTALAENPNDRRIRATLRELDKQIIGSLALLGFTPSDRSRLGVAEVQRESKLEALLRRRAEGI